MRPPRQERGISLSAIGSGSDDQFFDDHRFRFGLGPLNHNGYGSVWVQ